MIIREAGILFHGTPIVYTNYQKAGNINLNLICTSKLIRELLCFSKCIIPPIEYFEGLDYSIVIKKGTFNNAYGEKQEILAFIVLGKDYKIEMNLRTKILPLLENLLAKFLDQYNGRELLNLEQFEGFKTTINKVLEQYQFVKT